MVNLNGLNMLGPAKADAQERVKSASQRSTETKASSFKDLFGQTQQKVNGPSQQNSKKKDSTEADRQDSQKDAKFEKSNNRAEAKADRAEKFDRSEKENRSDVNDRAEARSLPGAPSAPKNLDRGPKFDAQAPRTLAMKQNRLEKAEVGQAEENDSLANRVAWNEFLRKMNDELGVSADEVMEAFQSLDESELAAPPDQNVDKLVMSLGLNSQQSDMARKMFMDLLQKTKSKSLGAELGVAGASINLSLMSQRELQRKQLQSSLEKMNSQFFMTSPGQKAGDLQAMKAALAQQSNPNQTPMNAAAGPMAENASLNNAALEMSEGESEFGSELSSSLGTNGSDATKKMNELVAAMQPVTQAEAKQVAEAAAAAKASSSEAAAKAFAQVINSKLAGDSESSDGDESSQENSDLMSQSLPTNPNFAANKAEGGFQIGAPTGLQAAQGPQPMAVQDFIDKASVMVREGGGEMKVSLTPEGLGEVSMKVSVDKGRVNVQMITESDEAKRLIEKGLADLKSNLHANNLSVDQIKIDTATNLGRQLEQQFYEQQRQNAQQFLENFRQNQQGWRQDFLPQPSAAVARSQSSGSSSQPTPYYNASGKRANSNRRLDLVA